MLMVWVLCLDVHLQQRSLPLFLPHDVGLVYQLQLECVFLRVCWLKLCSVFRGMVVGFGLWRGVIGWVQGLGCGFRV